MTGLLDPTAVRDLAGRLALRPTKQRGQNFVVDANTVRRIVASSKITSDDVVLEIGPGLGSLTLGLLEVARHVIAVEIDETLAGALPDTVAARMPGRSDALDVVVADALKITELPGPPPTAVVANLPYNVAVPVMLHLLATFDSWRHGLVMVQLEVADRLVAGPGSRTYGVPSGETGLARGVVPRRAGLAVGVLARAERGVGSGADQPPSAADHHRDPRAGVLGG